MKKVFSISILMILSQTAFSQFPAYPIEVQKSPAKTLKVYNYTKCTQYFLIAGLKKCDGCYQSQEDFLTETFHEVPPINEDGTPGYKDFNAVPIFQEYDGNITEAYISHVKIPHDSPPKCLAGQIIGGIYCLTASTQTHYYGMMHCEEKCYSILAIWNPAIECEGTASLTFKEYNLEP